MSAQGQPHVERRKNTSDKMTDDQFRNFTMQSLEEGKGQFQAIDSRLVTLAEHMETMSKALAENTEMTKQTAELAQKTAVLAQQTAIDTADLVKISQFGTKVSKFGKFTASVISGATRFASRLSKLLIPILLVGAIITALWHGEPLKWKDIIEAFKS